VASIDEINRFLKEFKRRLSMRGKFLFVLRDVNLATLSSLGITVKHAKEIINNLTYEDYCLGPEKDKNDPKGNIWCFGSKINGSEIYIKLSDHFSFDNAKCVSFHVACDKLTYPHKGH
jgi:hypothetical protein